MHSRNLNKCTLELRNKWIRFKEAATSLGIQVIITCTSRTFEEQEMLFAQGRKSLSTVNELRTKCGYLPITEADNKKVTWTLDSKHVRPLSEAVDYVILRDGKVCWDVKADVNKDNISDYQQLAKVATDLGLRAGAYFKKPDYCHLEV